MKNTEQKVKPVNARLVLIQSRNEIAVRLANKAKTELIRFKTPIKGTMQARRSKNRLHTLLANHNANLVD